MHKRTIISNGKKYIVNCPGGGEEGIGAGCPSGTAWLKDELGNWYSVQLTGLSGSLSFSLTQLSASNYSVGMNNNDFGFQLVQANDGQNYQVYVTSAGPTLTISQCVAPYNSSKPFLFLQSKTDGAYYYVAALNTTGTISLAINANSRIAGSLVSPLN